MNRISAPYLEAYLRDVTIAALERIARMTERDWYAWQQQTAPRPPLIRTGPRLGTYRPPAPPSTVNVGENKRHGGKVRIKRRYGEADVVRILEIRTDLHGLGIDLLTRALCAEWGYVSRTTVQRGLATYRNIYGDTDND